MTIQIEEGKFYKRADGSVHGPAGFRGDSARRYPWGVGYAVYTNDGRYYSDQRDHEFDLVAEAAEASAPASDDHAVETVEGPQIAEPPEWHGYTITGLDPAKNEAEEERPAWAPAVGDKVKSTACPEAGVGVVTDLLDDGRVRVDYKDTWFGVCTDTASSLEPVKPTLSELAAADPPDVKAQIADEAKRIVSGARRSAYGKPEQNFERIARFWQAYFENTGRGDVKITAADVSPLMRLMKEARLAESPNHYDSFVDLIGYTLTGAEVNGVSKPT